MVAMKSSIAEVMWKRMMAAKIINMADGGTENQKQENLLKKEKGRHMNIKHPVEWIQTLMRAETENGNCNLSNNSVNSDSLDLVGKSPCVHLNSLFLLWTLTLEVLFHNYLYFKNTTLEQWTPKDKHYFLNYLFD